LQNNLNRWYDPSVGRWLSEDPIGYEAEDFNLYRYVRNNPVNLTDATGEAVSPPAWYYSGGLLVLLRKIDIA
jgi:uncharacterized protein RhaS with RHS repeats